MKKLIAVVMGVPSGIETAELVFAECSAAVVGVDQRGGKVDAGEIKKACIVGVDGILDFWIDLPGQEGGIIEIDVAG